MDNDVFIFEITEKSFNSAVLLNSNKIPVVVEFMGVWSEPCIVMSDMFSVLAREFAGQFIFAKIDIDEQPGLKEQYNIKNVPTTLVFRNAEVVRTEEGQLTEAEARVLLKDYGVYRKSDEMRMQAREKHMAGDTAGAVVLLTEAIQKDPSNTRIAMDMVQIFMDTDQIEQARNLFARLPQVDRDSDIGKSINGQLLFKELAAKTEGLQSLKEKVLQNPGNVSMRFDLAMCQVADYQFREALDNLFIILQAEPDYKEGATREMIITLVNMLVDTEPEMAQEYRRKLANVLAE